MSDLLYPNMGSKDTHNGYILDFIPLLFYTIELKPGVQMATVYKTLFLKGQWSQSRSHLTTSITSCNFCGIIIYYQTYWDIYNCVLGNMLNGTKFDMDICKFTVFYQTVADALQQWYNMPIQKLTNTERRALARATSPEPLVNGCAGQGYQLLRGRDINVDVMLDEDHAEAGTMKGKGKWKGVRRRRMTGTRGTKGTKGGIWARRAMENWWTAKVGYFYIYCLMTL
ncbi:hypothetical protein PAXRUDRAFT_164264 [Paxillus rubicundulus Ve08.2h10]|uniref:Uncharacterized protein n=1 Tax=Paxillus rubicundulus Ve08.2h10 TaxID=930991 RepID=A0A0D0CSI2_9AGAM|nr:hypothetical protein PAXRUDRAFT_164264 [Paxillus rubicundulus Ve08.2h10]